MSRAGGEYAIPQPISRDEEALCRQLADDLQLPPVMGELLHRRGFASAAAAKSFLNPQLADLPSPMALKGMDKAADLLIAAIERRLQVAIHGDYDVDGITATVLLADFLKKIGLETVCHLPNRLTDEYGLTVKSVVFLAQKTKLPALLITVDCGISATEAVCRAQELGFAVIITDHHVPAATGLPAAEAVVNPRQQGCSFACKDLSGVGVVLFFIMALRRKLVEKGFWTESSMPRLREYLDLAALGTVADVVPLTGANRILVRAGLEVISERGRPGIRAVCERACLQERFVSAEHISYQLAPRINAAGRLGNPWQAAALLQTTDADDAACLARDLEDANLLRRDLEAVVLGLAVEQAERQAADGWGCLVLYGHDWHPGVIGIVAARMIDRYQLPSLVFTGDAGHQDLFKGSGRSVPGLNLHHVLEQCQDWIVRFGGHAMAAGLTVRAQEFDGFCVEFSRCVRAAKCANQPQGIHVDAVLDKRTDWLELVRGLQLMEPFGQGNPEPVFLLQNVRLQQLSRLREHLRFVVPAGSASIKGIGFFMAELFEAALQPVDLCFKLKQTHFRGRMQIEMHAVALRPASGTPDLGQTRH